MGPADALNDLVDRLHASEEPDFDLIGEIGCGDLENLVHGHGDELWPEIERLARADPIFRRALRCVWAYDSPEFARRDQLLRELGEHWPVTVRFVVQPEDLLPDARVSWRAVEIDGEPAAGQLARLLREIADWYEHERYQTENPHVDGIGRAASGLFYEWSQATWHLQRAWHRLDVAGDAEAFTAAVAAVDEARSSEQEGWRAFMSGLHDGPTTTP